jgi:DNA-binding MarR family transcriptional regulator
MTLDEDLIRLADVLNGIAALYQFRSVNERLYGTLTVSQSYCLRLLYFQGPRTMSEVAGALRVRLSTITGVIDQLEDKGLVERTDHPDDRRSLHVRLTGDGRSLYRTAHEAFLSHLKPLLDKRGGPDRENLLAFLGEIKDAISGWQKNPRTKATSHGKKNSKH